MIIEEQMMECDFGEPIDVLQLLVLWFFSIIVGVALGFYVGITI